jgi:hypothetical protein
MKNGRVGVRQHLYTVCIGRIGLVVFCIGSEGIKDHDTIKQS